MLFAANRGVLDNVENLKIQEFKTEWFKYLTASLADIEAKLNTGSKLLPEDEETLLAEQEKFRDNIFLAVKA